MKLALSLLGLLFDRTKPLKIMSHGDGVLLMEIFKRLFVQSGNHKKNLVYVFVIMLNVLSKEFNEDNESSLIALMQEALDSVKESRDSELSDWLNTDSKDQMAVKIARLIHDNIP